MRGRHVPTRSKPPLRHRRTPAKPLLRRRSVYNGFFTAASNLEEDR